MKIISKTKEEEEKREKDEKLKEVKIILEGFKYQIFESERRNILIKNNKKTF